MKLFGLNYHEKHLQSLKHSLSWGSLDYDLFIEEYYDVFSKTNGSLHIYLYNGWGRITMVLGEIMNLIVLKHYEQGLQLQHMPLYGVFHLSGVPSTIRQFYTRMTG